MSRSNSKLFIVFLIFLLSFSSAGKEIIKDFDVVFELESDLNMKVTEKITVISEGVNIRRGIYREFPTKYKTFFRGNVNVSFDVISVKRDGRDEPFHIQKEMNGTRIYIGEKSVLLDPGKYTYEIVYNTSRQIFFGKEHDEIYWNITGQGWDFDIEKARCYFVLSDELKHGIIDAEGFTGSQGELGKDFSFYYDDKDNPVFETNRPLRKRTGFSAKLLFRKGILKEPDLNQKISFFFQDNLHILFGVFGLAVVFVFYLVMWSKYGVDPPKGTIIPRFEAPDNMSACECGYLLNMGWDDRFMSSEIISLAIRGYIKIVEVTTGKFMLQKLKSPDNDIADFEKKFMEALFSSGNELTVDKKQYMTIAKAKTTLTSHLDGRFNKVLYHNNYGLTAIGVFITFLAMGAALFFGDSLNPQAVFMAVWLFIWNIGVSVLVLTAYKSWKTVLKNGRDKAKAVGMTLFSLPFIFGDIAAIVLFGSIVSFPLIIIIIISFIINVLFAYLMKAPTVYGRHIMDKIEGLKMYLSVAEKEWLQRFTPPEKTPEEFEKFLPHAVALEVENEWGEQFTSIFSTDGADDGTRYYPGWYRGAMFTNIGFGGFVNNMSSSFSSAVSSASTPASSGGSGGAGGGGGGGGGGGW